MKQKIKIFFQPKKLFYKSCLVFLGIVSVLNFSLNLALAGCNFSVSADDGDFSFSIDINEVMDCAERRYGYDQDILRRTKRKESVPQVEIFFDKSEPKEGEKVTATAVPRSFKNSNENLYYTWYVIHTDEDGNPTNTINEGMIEAMGIVARGAFNWQYFYPGKTKNEVYAGGASDPDEDSFEAPIGGADGVGAKSGTGVGDFEDQHFSSSSSGGGGDAYSGSYSSYAGKGVVSNSAITRCYRHNFGYKYPNRDTPSGFSSDYFSGRDLIVKCKHKFPSIPRYKIGDGRFGNAEESYWETDPNNPDTDGDGVIDEADLAGLNQQQFTWNYRKGDLVGVVVEGTSMISINDDRNSGYYKIMWASPGICSYKERDFVDGNECFRCMEGQSNCPEEVWRGSDFSDYGFNYLAAIPVNQEASKPLEVVLNFKPQNPQFDVEKPEYSDLITVTASLNNEGVDEDYVYYNWYLEICDEDDFENCNSFDLNKVKLETFLEGTGVKEIKFTPIANDLIDEPKKYLKVTVTARRHKNDKIGIANTIIPIAQNNLDIKLFRVVRDGNVWKKGEEICDTDNYRKLCPVYPFQVLAAEIETTDGSGFDPDGDESIAWQINSLPINPPMEGIFSGLDFGGGAQGTFDKLVYFPITSSEDSVVSISATAQNNSGKNDLISERLLSVKNPLAVIVQEDASGAEITNSGETAVFEAEYDETIRLRAKPVPNYLDFFDADDGIVVQWFINGELVNTAFAALNPQLEIATTEDSLSFKNKASFGNGYNIQARVIKNFSVDEETVLNEAWNIYSNKLVFDTAINTKTKYNDTIIGSERGIKYFWASTAKNAPQYLIFAIRIAIFVVLVWVIFFGVFYALETYPLAEKKKKKIF